MHNYENNREYKLVFPKSQYVLECSCITLIHITLNTYFKCSAAQKKIKDIYIPGITRACHAIHIFVDFYKL